jgi:hypothetical protein
MANGAVVATQQVSRSWLVVGFSGRRALDHPEFSQNARTQRTRAPAVASLTELPSHPARAWREQAFGGPGFRNGSLTRTSLRHSLACRRYCGDTPFVFSLSHQFLTSLPARVLHRQAIRRPLLSCTTSCNPQGRHLPLSLRWPVSFRNTSGVSVETQVQSSRTAPVRASRTVSL